MADRPLPSASGTLAGGGSLRLVSAGIGIVGGLLVSVVLVRELGIYRFGIYAFVVGVVGLAGVLADAGVGTALSRMGSFLDPETARSWARGSLRLSILSGSVLTAAVLACLPLVPDDVRMPLAVAAPLVLISSLRSAEVGFLSARRRVVALELTTICTQLAVYVAVLSLATLATASVETVLAVQVVIRAAGVVALAFAWRRSDDAAAIAPPTPRREILAFSLPLMLSGVAGVVLQRSDVVLLGMLASLAAAGAYAPVLRVFDVAPVIVGAIGYYFFAVGSALVRDRDFERLREGYVSITKWGMVLTMPLLTTMLVLPSPVLETLYGRAFTGADAVARVLAIGFIVNVITGVNGGALVALGATRQIAVRSVVLMTANVVLNIALIPRYGALGAALATTCVTVSLNAFNSLLIWRLARLHPVRHDTVAFSVAISVAAGLATVLVYAAGLQQALLGSVALFAAVLAAGAGTALATMRPAERRLVSAMLTRLRSFRAPDLDRDGATVR